MTLTVTALKWVPDFAAGQVRDHRVRWILNEVGWPYEVRLLDAPAQASGEYRQIQPFGQVPALLEDGRPPMFESGAIVIDVALRAGQLIGKDEVERAQILGWAIAALNSIEPFLANVAEVEYFVKDEARRPLVVEAAKDRLKELQLALGDRTWLVGEAFSVADLLMGSVLAIASRLGLLDDFPALAAYHARCFARPALRAAVDQQLQDISKHEPADMRYDQKA